MKITKYIFIVFLLCMLCVNNIYYKDEVSSIDGMEQLENGDTSNPVHTEYDGIALTLIICQGVLIAGGVAGYLIYKKNKDKKEKEKAAQTNSSSSTQFVFYSSYDNAKKDETQNTSQNTVENTTQNEVKPVFTSTSTFSTSSIVNGPSQNDNSN